MGIITDDETSVLNNVSQKLFGNTARLRIVDPKELILLKKNARIFKKDTFKQLTENIQKDGRLSSMPLCWRMDDGKLEVLSGNHRVQASIQAGLHQILVLVIEEKLSKAQQIAIQLSHNSLVGEDDPNILAELWASIDDISSRVYAGLSSDIVENLEKMELISFTTPQVYSRSITFAFVEDEAERLNNIIESLESLPAKDINVLSLQHFERFYELLETAKTKFTVKNTSLAMLQLMDIAEQALAKIPEKMDGVNQEGNDTQNKNTEVSA